MKKAIWSGLILSGLLSACGGGGGTTTGTTPSAAASPTATPTPTAPTPTAAPLASAAGIWTAHYVFNSTDDYIWLNLPSGEYWSFYWVNNKMTGLLQGNYSTSGTNISSNNGLDFDVATMNKPDALTFTGTVIPQTTMELTTVVTGSTVKTNFGFHNNTYLKADVAALAGNYTGKSYSKNYPAGVSEGFSLAADGKITSTATACSYTGQLTAMSDANAYHFSVTFGAAPCDNAGMTMTGVAVKSALSNEIIVGGLNAARNNAFLFVGAK